jgi:deoxyadenosine/deoxycytidine kinase
MSNSIVIDGNIGSGKTTVIRSLCNEYNCIEEPVNEWAPYLQEFYKDMKGKSLLFQMKVLQHHMKNNKCDINYILERSPLSCIHIFGQKLKDDQYLSKLDIDLMVDMNKDFGWYPQNVIYINTPPKVCYDRIHERSRENEIIPYDYLQSISNLYDELYLNKSMNINIPNIYIVDGTQSKENILAEIKKIINVIRG